jgi:hypothetical protein
MQKELTEKLLKRFTTWFHPSGDSRQTSKPLRFRCGNGWIEIVLRLCVDLEPLVTELEMETGERFEVVQVEEHLGTLRFYVSHHSDAINKRIAEAQRESSRTCEVCGELGKWFDEGSQIRARCETHVHN